MWKRVLLFIGILLCVYPFIRPAFTARKQQTALEAYEQNAEAMDEAKLQGYLERAKERNKGPCDYTLQEYEKELDPLETGVMGWLEISKIDVKLPIYHGAEEDVLAKGIGHVYGSSLPVGGESTHCFLAGHRGLPSAELFARLGELEEGDVFAVHVCNEIFVYEVCEIRVVAPDNTEVMKIQSGRDLLSLVTCTPYGINTHRLIVTGERKEKL